MAIAAAVVEQAAATQEIARSVELVSGNTANVAAEHGAGAGRGQRQRRNRVRGQAHRDDACRRNRRRLGNEVKDFLAALNELGDGEQLLTSDDRMLRQR